VTRRELLLLPAAGLLPAQASGASEAQNLSFPLRQIPGQLTDRNLFFVRDHFQEPELSLETWTLTIEGCVAHPREFTFSDLLEAPTRKIEAVLECAGNLAGGFGVSNGIWEGVPLSTLLATAAPSSDAVEVEFEGADEGHLFQHSPNLPYARVVPLQKCLEPSSMLAFKLNGLFLPVRNGFPARALFPGWYAMDSVKWLRRIVVRGCEKRASAFHESGMDRLYNRVQGLEDGSTRSMRLSSIQVKSAIAWPGDGVKLPAGRHLVWGFAWSGTGTIRNVAVSVDGGKNWDAAKLDATPGPLRWIRWSYSWAAPPGDFLLMSRASDTGGNEQPVERDRTRKDYYELNWSPQLHCSVR
jgi:DMSO/TMAO reductase YedYZ molybdopterin-dependent catalytic subunit